MKKIVAWSYELAKAVDKSKPTDDPSRWCNWGLPQLSFTKPNVPDGSIRNLTALVAAEEGTE